LAMDGGLTGVGRPQGAAQEALGEKRLSNEQTFPPDDGSSEA